MPGALPHRRPVLLFLVAVILPSTVLAALGIRLIAQEREIQRSRLADDRRAALAEIRDIAIAELGGIETRALRSLEATPVRISAGYADPAIRMVARIHHGRFIPPWEESPSLLSARRTLAEPAFAALIRAGEHAELGQNDARSALSEYRAAFDRAGSESQRGLARLLIARATTAMGGRGMAEALYTDLLESPDSIVDEHGVPFALYAAARLHDWSAIPDRIERRLREEIARNAWRSPTAFYLLRDLVRSTGIETGALEGEQIRLESVLAVERDYGLLAGARSSTPGNGLSDPVWVGLGPGDWLARVIGQPDGEPAGVVAVSATALADRIRAVDIARDSAFGTMEIGLAGRVAGSALGIARPDLAVAFVEPAEAIVGRTMRLPNAFLLAALALVLSMTLFGGYLLLNDVKREMRVAEMRSDFVSSVSHELKTPLTAIRMFAETLRHGAQRDPAVTAEHLDTIIGESERLSRLLNNVLDLSKIEQGQKTYIREPAALAEIAERAARAVEYPLSSEGFRLHLDLADGMPPVLVDGDSVEQAVLNLLTNAMKYSDASRDIDLSLYRRNGHAVIAVRDRGIGIPLEDQPRLTEKFYRVQSPQNAAVPGTGLGLTLVEHTTHAHGGFLTIDSAPGEGSTFSIHIPIEVAP